MALVASALIDAAQKRTFGARGRQKVSKATLLEELSYQDQVIVQMFSQIAPDLLATITGTLTVTTNGNINGYTLVSGIHYRDFVHVDTVGDVYKSITMLRRQDGDKAPMSPAAMLRMSATGGVLYPVDPLQKRWTDEDVRLWFNPVDEDTVTYSYVPLPVALTTLASELLSPDMAREAILSALEVSILLSRSVPDQTRIQVALAKREAAFNSLRMTAYKFVGPQGSKTLGQGGGNPTWLDSQIGGGS